MKNPARLSTLPRTAELPARDPLLAVLGERVRTLRARKGLTRKALALAADVSERHLANMESGTGNVSILVLQQIALALGCEVAELLTEESFPSAEWTMIRDVLSGRSDVDLKRARVVLGELFGSMVADRGRSCRIALIGLRGAGKSSLGHELAQKLGYSFVEINRDIERLAGCSVPEIHSLYGVNAYRRYERRALEEAIQIYPEVVIATPGGLVSDAFTFNLLLTHCFTVWLQATPEEHMQRVVAQGDLRPMAGNSGNAEAMDDLRRILSGREAFYSRADLTYSTAGQTPEQSLFGLLSAVRRELALGV